MVSNIDHDDDDDEVHDDGRDDDGDDRDDDAVHDDHHGHVDDEADSTIYHYKPAATIDTWMAMKGDSLCELLLELIYVHILIEIIDIFGSSHLI